MKHLLFTAKTANIALGISVKHLLFIFKTAYTCIAHGTSVKHRLFTVETAWGRHGILIHSA